MLKDSQILKKLDKYKVECSCAQCGSSYVVNKYDARRSHVGHICNDCKTLVSGMTQVTQASLLKAFSYDPVTGKLVYKTDSLSGKCGEEAGYPHKEGYRQVAIGRKEYLVHRLIWLMRTGYWPHQVDHIDHDRANNSWTNLREVQSRENQMNMGLRRNNSSGHQGVRLLPSKRWCAYIMVNRKQVSLGTFDDIEDAIAARKAGEVQYGFHANHGT